MTKPPWLADPGCKSILRVSEVASAGEDRYATEGAVSWSGTISGCMFIYTNKPPLASTSFFDIHYIYTYVYIIPFIPSRWLSPAIRAIIFSRWFIESYYQCRWPTWPPPKKNIWNGQYRDAQFADFPHDSCSIHFFQTCSGHHWPEAGPVSGWSKRSDPGWGSLQNHGMMGLYRGKSPPKWHPNCPVWDVPHTGISWGKILRFVAVPTNEATCLS